MWQGEEIGKRALDLDGARYTIWTEGVVVGRWEGGCRWGRMDEHGPRVRVKGKRRASDQRGSRCANKSKEEEQGRE